MCACCSLSWAQSISTLSLFFTYVFNSYNLVALTTIVTAAKKKKIENIRDERFVLNLKKCRNIENSLEIVGKWFEAILYRFLLLYYCCDLLVLFLNVKMKKIRWPSTAQKFCVKFSFCIVCIFQDSAIVLASVSFSISDHIHPFGLLFHIINIILIFHSNYVRCCIAETYCHPF